jgi:hypothetical protein
VYRARFHLDQFHLSPADLKDPTLLKFARECSIRLNINPPAGKKVTNITANTQFAVDKPEGTKLTALTELKIGNATLGKVQGDYSSMETIKGRDEVISLKPGTAADEQFPSLQCTEPKIIAFNYTFIAERGSASEDVNVKMTGAKTLEIEAELSDCN